ncbi:TolB family protein [Micromonospora halophytica]|uniref:WD40-like Beta Propeller Repeat n=1 Tax=Micromonospora halophytica TaxID=47864 RepID=A0A1C5GY84_9ACTN|nr:hypothetical protein [Micromonospora halophytica]SCG38710.1 hypothetical protein GA0070560_102304 [Micromonospora halophytica]
MNRTITALAALVGVVTVAATAPGWLATPAAAGSAETVPTRLYDPWLWQATVGQHPAGPASVVFFTSNTRYAESTGVLVGRDGGYRLIPMRVGEGHGLLSPDGRHYLRPGWGTLIDLTTGDERAGHPAGLHPLAWSPDGRRLLASRDNDDSVITYGPDNEQLNDPAKPDDLLVVDPYAGTSRPVAAGAFASHTTGAWSPDGTLLAVAGPVDPAGDQERLAVTDPVAGGVRWQRDLDEWHRLAGRGAWSPDGRRIALFGFTGCTGVTCTDEQLAARSWRLDFLDAATGQPVGAPVPLEGWPTELVGWRGGDPVLVELSTGATVPQRRASLVATTPEGRRQTLMTGPTGSSGIEVPARLLVSGAFTGPAPRPSPWAAPGWLYATLLLPPLLLTILLLRRRARRGSPGVADTGGSRLVG